MTLKAALSLFGLGEQNLTRGKATPKGLLRRSATSRLPMGVNDIKSATSMEDIAVTFFNAAVHTTVAGSHKPKATVLASSNDSFIGTDP